jgi:DNA-binding transcriptional regulator GbsR (MarR family)
MAQGGEDSPPIREVEDRFIACWTGLAALWGVSPAHGRIQALLLLAPRPLDAESIRRRIGISHGSCSTGLNELLDWGVIRRVNVPGSRRAKYATDPDGWKWFHRCVRERRRREIGPLLDRMRDARAHAEETVRRAREQRLPGQHDLARTRDRVRAFADFLEEFGDLVDAFLALEEGRPTRLLRSLGRAARSGGGA